jgi:hypothetical protein
MTFSPSFSPSFRVTTRRQDFTKIIAINEGKLRDFILGKTEYKWLGKQVYHYLNSDGFVPHESLIFVNLNSRSVVDTDDSVSSILDKLLDRLLDAADKEGFWKPCSAENCAFADRCYVKYNVDSLRDSKKGPIIRATFEAATARDSFS